MFGRYRDLFSTLLCATTVLSSLQILVSSLHKLLHVDTYEKSEEYCAESIGFKD